MQVKSRSLFSLLQARQGIVLSYHTVLSTLFVSKRVNYFSDLVHSMDMLVDEAGSQGRSIKSALFSVQGKQKEGL